MGDGDKAEHMSIAMDGVGKFGYESVDKLLDSIVNVNDAEEINKQERIIPRVHELLRNVESNEGCFDPMVVSIGPYHYSQPKLKEMEAMKIKWAKQFARGIGPKTMDLTQKLRIAYDEVKKVAEEARRYYDQQETEKYSNEEFTMMMFLDGCFVLHFIHMYSYNLQEIRRMRNQVVALINHDLFLLENQLPFVVLRALIDARWSDKGHEAIKAIERFIKMTSGVVPPTPTITIKHEDRHLLYLLRKQFVDHLAALGPSKDDSSSHGKGKKPPAQGEGSSWYSFRSAKELNNLGIKLKANKSGKFSDVRFESYFWLYGELTLPPLIVDDSTKSMLLNLLALETCQECPDDLGVTSYVCLMDSLLDKVDDVMLLRSHNVLMNYLGSDQQVADLFNNISTNLVPHPKVYADVKAQIEAHYKNSFKTRIAAWMLDWLRTHFKSPWTVLAPIIKLH